MNVPVSSMLSISPARNEFQDHLPLESPGSAVVAQASHTDRYTASVTSSWSQAYEILAKAVDGRTAFVVADTTVDALFGDKLCGALNRRSIAVQRFTMDAGERYKSIGTALKLIDWLVAAGMKRRDVIIALGGGVVIDTVGWAASIFMRGVPYINVPTSLLAQVDAGLGGKVGVNHAEAKNLVGGFHQPQAVVSPIEALRTLPPRHVTNGLSEVLKKAVIASPELFNLMEAQARELVDGDQDLLLRIVYAATQIKTTLIYRDPFEECLERPLNYGHTVGHAIETATSYGPLLHGECVAIGMAAAVKLARHRGLLLPAVADRMLRVQQSLGLPLSMSDAGVEVSFDDVISALEKIRAVRGGKLRFVLPVDVGTVEIRNDVSKAEIDWLLTKIGATYKKPS